MLRDKTQTLRILGHLKRHGNITSMEAFQKYSATRLSAIIFRLREEGFDIDTRKENKNNKSFGRYVLEDTQNNLQLLYEYRRLVN